MFWSRAAVIDGSAGTRYKFVAGLASFICAYVITLPLRALGMLYLLVSSNLSWEPMEINIGNPCAEKKTLHCINCHSHFMMIRPSIKSVVISRHFIRDLKDEKEMNSIIKDILDCSDLEFTELHKFEEYIDGNLIFRAKKDGMHIVYCVDKKMRIIFLRAFKNYSEYKRFLEDRKEIMKTIARV